MLLRPVSVRRLPHRPLLPVEAGIALAARRPFFTLPGGAGGEPQHLSATRTLPYASEPLYDLIADVDSYHRFLPYCADSRVTHWDPPDSRGRRWPARADMHVGWAGVKEAFTSRLHCVPGQSVEARNCDEDSASASSSIFKSLVTRWSLKPAAASSSGSPSTEVSLSITYHFTSPVYAALSAAISDKVAGMMIEAFEKEARDRLVSTIKR